MVMTNIYAVNIVNIVVMFASSGFQWGSEGLPSADSAGTCSKLSGVNLKIYPIPNFRVKWLQCLSRTSGIDNVEVHTHLKRQEEWGVRDTAGKAQRNKKTGGTDGRIP